MTEVCDKIKHELLLKNNDIYNLRDLAAIILCYIIIQPPSKHNFFGTQLAHSWQCQYRHSAINQM